MNINKTRLTESDYLEKIGYFIDKHIKSGNKTTPAITDLMAYVQKRIGSHKDIGASKSKKVIQKGYDDTKLNELESKSKAGTSKFVDKLSTFIAKMIAPTLEDETLSDKEKKDKIGKDIRGEKWVDYLPADVQNELDYSKYLYMESKRQVSNKDLKQLLEFIQEAEKSEKSKLEKEPESAKKSDTPKQAKKPENSKQEKNSEEDIVSPSKSVSSLLKSSGFSNFVQDASRMSSRRDKAEAYIQMLSALPSISDAYIRKSIINKFKTKE